MGTFFGPLALVDSYSKGTEGAKSKEWESSDSRYSCTVALQYHRPLWKKSDKSNQIQLAKIRQLNDQ